MVIAGRLMPRIGLRELAISGGIVLGLNPGKARDNWRRKR